MKEIVGYMDELSSDSPDVNWVKKRNAVKKETVKPFDAAAPTQAKNNPPESGIDILRKRFGFQ